MGELGELRNRVDQAVDRLSAANDARHRQNHGLTAMLTDLEAKFEARGEELEHCERRIQALARENADLSGLIDTLIHIVDTTVGAHDEDALFRASAMATELVADWSGPETPDEGTEPGPVDAAGPAEDSVAEDTASSDDGEPGIENEMTPELVHDAASEVFAGLDPASRFEDVSHAELEAEQLDGEPEDLATLLDTPLMPEPGDADATSEAPVSDALADEPFEVVSAEAEDVATLMEAAVFDAPDADFGDIETMALDGAGEPDPLEEMLAADLDIPEIVLDDDAPVSRIDADEDTESSIQALMARLEQAAARANVPDDETEAVADEAPAVAAG